jgi:hypothetical protein
MSDGELEKRYPSGELDLPGFELAILSKIHDLGLPTDNILVPVRQRVGVLNQMADVLDPVEAPCEAQARIFPSS